MSDGKSWTAYVELSRELVKQRAVPQSFAAETGSDHQDFAPNARKTETGRIWGPQRLPR